MAAAVALGQTEPAPPAEVENTPAPADLPPGSASLQGQASIGPPYGKRDRRHGRSSRPTTEDTAKLYLTSSGEDGEFQHRRPAGRRVLGYC